MFITFINWVLAISDGLGALGVLVLMTIESSFLPLPSEFVIPPAAWLASQGKMNLVAIIIAGTLGSMLGATINYYLSLWLGRLVVYRLLDTRFAKILRIKKSDLERTEEMFLKNANRATFIGRLLPVVRHLISIPAGFSKMPYRSFLFFTAIGSLLWVTILAVAGYTLGSNQDLIVRYYEELQMIVLIFGAAWLFYYLFKRRKKYILKKSLRSIIKK
jgi:membrane protein DedA with SNARE-associated domain